MLPCFTKALASLPSPIQPMHLGLQALGSGSWGNGLGRALGGHSGAALCIGGGEWVLMVVSARRESILCCPWAWSPVCVVVLGGLRVRLRALMMVVAAAWFCWVVGGCFVMAAPPQKGGRGLGGGCGNGWSCNG